MMDAKVTPCQEIRSEIYIHARQTKLLVWGELNRGECAQSNGQLALRSDGTGTWTCTTTTRSPYGVDVWHADFAVRDQNGKTLFGIGPFYSPQMTGGTSEEYLWSAPFTFSAEQFPAIHAAVQKCGCLPPAHALKQAARQEVVVEGGGWCRTRMGSVLGGAYA